MSVPSKIHNSQLVEIQPEERLAATSERNLAPCMVTGSEEQDEGKPQVRFCERAHSSFREEVAMSSTRRIRCYHGTPHEVTDPIICSICIQGLKYEPALTNNFAMAAWHALKRDRENGTVIVCDINIYDAKYTFCRSKNEHKMVYKLRDVPPTNIIEILAVTRNEHGMAKVVNRIHIGSESYGPRAKARGIP